MLTVVFGEQPAPELRGPVTPELYERLFPTGAQGTGAPEEEEPGFEPRGGRGDRARARHAAAVRVGQLGGRRRAGLRQPRPGARPVPAGGARRDRVGAAPRRASSPPSTSRASASSPTSRTSNETSHFAGVRYEAADRQPGVPPPGPPLHARDPRDDGGGPGARVLLRPLALHVQRDDGRRPRGARAAALRRGRGGLAVDPLRPGGSRAASSTTTPARCGPAWATMWAAT